MASRARKSRWLIHPRTGRAHLITDGTLSGPTACEFIGARKQTWSAMRRNAPRCPECLAAEVI